MSLYSDVNQSNPFSKERVTDEDSVQQALYNLVRTRKGERVYHPEYGLDIEYLLFELITDDVALELQVRIKTAITKWEPRVKIVRITVDPEPDNNTYNLTMHYKIKGLGDRQFRFNDSLSTATGAG
ncbi:GPW/gp25 family protein [Pseudoalteromonas umbrosa]|uniref:GPW/gp25 family protein n=1 Tax=Pseudoalteromonas umbrosa TaxID=3048489 RepID=UPI0024C275BB|nr:GPW/gp25 family protein [Pseudoalteromonas sp. B95]MDK1290224.1 GPW/gp25 family protein [Pseudoalteromonas sp. B95]